MSGERSEDLRVKSEDVSREFRRDFRVRERAIRLDLITRIVRERAIRLDLITRIVRERQRELEGFSELRAVSDFAHRGRIQSFLRGRFLRSERSHESVAAIEIGQLRQRHLVSGLREGFHFQLENIARTQSEEMDDALISTNDQLNEEQQQYDTINHQHLQSVTENYESHQAVEMLSTTDVERSNMTDNLNLQQFINEGDDLQEPNANQMAEDEDEENYFTETREWHEDVSHENIENVENRSFDSPRSHDITHNIELRELLSRRHVSTILHNGFHASVPQLNQSYVQHEDHILPERDAPFEDEPQEDLASTPPSPPLQQEWHNLHHSETEYDLRNDIANKFQEVMNHMQRMFEVCMDMNIELQRSVKQEVSAALNRCSCGVGISENSVDANSKYSLVKKGTCCVCCDSHIDSLFYRCGHMCTCSNCANELIRETGKCPICRAPIAEVIRAYSMF